MDNLWPFLIGGGGLALGWLFKTYLPVWQVRQGDQQEHRQEMEEAQLENEFQTQAARMGREQQNQSAVLRMAEKAMDQNNQVARKLEQILDGQSAQGQRIVQLIDRTTLLTGAIEEIRNQDERREKKRTGH